MSNKELSALDSLNELGRFIAMLDTNNIFSTTITDELDNVLKELNERSNPMYGYFDLKAADIARIQKMIDMVESPNVHAIKKVFDNDKVLSQILLNMEKFTYKNIPLSKDAAKNFVRETIRAVSRNFIIRLAEDILKKYLSAGNWHNNNMRLLVYVCYKSIKETNPLFISNLDLYLNDIALNSAISKNYSEVSYEKALKRIGIDERYIHCDYFATNFYYWFMNNAKIELFSMKETIPSLDQNEYYLKVLTPDEKKLILATIYKQLYNNASFEAFEKLFYKIDEKIFFHKQDDKTEKSFWTISSAQLSTEKNLALLDDAHRYCCLLLQRELLTQFFDILGGTDFITRERADFWRSFILASAFEDIKFVLTDRQLNTLKASLDIGKTTSINRFIVRNYSYARNQSPALILFFKNLVIVEFLNLGNGTQVYTRETFFKYFSDSLNTISGVNSYKIFTNSVFDSYTGEGRIVHNAVDWMTRTRRFLNQHGISSNR